MILIPIILIVVLVVLVVCRRKRGSFTCRREVKSECSGDSNHEEMVLTPPNLSNINIG